MRAPVLIGDEVTAAGFRLAGARVLVPAAGQETQAFQQAREDSDLVLVTAELARRMPDRLLREAYQSGQPLLLVVPDARGHVSPTDLTTGLRRQLGLNE